jgi:hypothetical protein
VPRNAFPGFLRTRCGDFSALTLPLSISGADSIAKKRRFYWRAGRIRTADPQIRYRREHFR